MLKLAIFQSTEDEILVLNLSVVAVVAVVAVVRVFFGPILLPEKELDEIHYKVPQLQNYLCYNRILTQKIPSSENGIVELKVILNILYFSCSLPRGFGLHHCYREWTLSGTFEYIRSYLTSFNTVPV